MSSARLAVEPSGPAAADPARTRTAGGGAAIASAGSRAGAYEHPCPTCAAQAGRPCWRSLGRRGRRRPQTRTAPHAARLEVATSFAHQGSPLGALSADVELAELVRADHPQR